MTPSHTRKLALGRYTAFRASFLAILALFLWVHLSQFTTQGVIYPVTDFGRGGDFVDFFRASKRIVTGESPYRSAVGAGGAPYLHNKPPLFSLFVATAWFLDETTVILLFQLSIIAIAIMVVLLLRSAYAIDFWGTIALYLAIVLSLPFEFLLDRGNVDGHSLFFAFLAFFLLGRQRPISASLALAVAINIKTNILALVPAFAAAGSLLASALYAGFAVVATLAILGLMPQLGREFFTIATARAAWATGKGENASIFRVFYRVPYGDDIGYVIFIGCTLALLCGFYRQQLRLGARAPVAPLDRLLLAMPIAFAYPRQSYTYGLVFFPTMLILYARLARFGAKWERLLGWAGCVGVVLSCFPSIYVWKFLSSIKITSSSPYLFNALGVLICVLVNAVAVWRPIPKVMWERQERPSWLRIGSVPEWAAFATLSLAAVFFSTRYFVLGSERILFFSPISDFERARPIAGQRFRVGRAVQGWGSLMTDLGVMGKKLSIAGREFEKGLGTHAQSHIDLYFPAGTRRFSGACGIDDGSQGKAAGAIFQIRSGEHILFETKVHKSGTPPESFDLNVEGLSGVELIVDQENAADPSSWNQADWVDLTTE